MFEKQKPIQKDNLHNQVYERLCTMLRQGEFNPGESVAVARIAEAFGVSPMPVREALLRLQAMGVLSNVSGRSVGVPQATEENLIDIRNVRLEVEPKAVEWSIKNSDDKFISELSEIYEKLIISEQKRDIQAFVKENYTFHFRLYEQSNSPVLMQIIDNLWLKVSPYLYHSKWIDRFKISNINHRRIIEAISAHDVPSAKKALIDDISHSYEDLISILFHKKPTDILD